MFRQVFHISRRISLLLLLLSPAALAQTPSAAPGLQQGLDALSQGRYAEAAAALEQHTRLQPEDLKALQALAEAYLLLNQPQLAEVTLKAAHSLNRDDARTHLLRGQLRYAQQDYVRAMSELRTVLYLKAASAEMYYHMALTHQALNEGLQARNALMQGLQSTELTPDTRARLLLLQVKLQPELAEAALKQAAALQDLSPELSAEVLSQEADLLIAAGRTQELIRRQIAQLEAALVANQSEQALRLMREIDSWIGRSAEAELDRRVYRQMLESLYERQPGQALLRRQLLQMYQREKLHEEMLAFYRLELQTRRGELTDQELAAAFHRIADVHLKMGYLQFAFDNYQRASEKDPRDSEALKRMGVIYLSAKDPGEAIKLFLRIQKEQPLDRENQLFLSLALALKQEDTQARQLLAGLPPEIRPEVRARIEALLVSSQRQSEDGLWKLLIPEEQILENH